MTAIIKFCVLAWFMLSYVALALPIHLSLFSGDGTFYNVGLGSCGITNTDKELVAALNAPQMGSSGNPNGNKNCGRKAEVEGPKGKVTVKIVDTCPPCKKGDLDLSPAAFSKIADFDQGRVHIKWKFIS